MRLGFIADSSVTQQKITPGTVRRIIPYARTPSRKSPFSAHSYQLRQIDEFGQPRLRFRGAEEEGLVAEVP
jgi:hypothetical protein